MTTGNEPAKVVLTIFTPAYNRADLLPRLFESIASQVQPGDPVEWLIIDDGSTDDTTAVLQQFQRTRPDLVRYQSVENGGKHRAINRAAQLAQGAWVMIVDSDDLLLPQAVSSAMAVIQSVDSDPSIGLIRGLKHFPEKPTERSFSVPQNPGTHAQWVSAQPTWDTAEVVRRSALQQHPFPDFPGERFMAEGWLWHALDRSHLTYFINQAWIECFYQADGLSASSRRIRVDAPEGAMAVYGEMLASPLPWRLRVRAGINWWRFRFHAADNGIKAANMQQAPLWLAALGWLAYRRDRALGQ